MRMKKAFRSFSLKVSSIIAVLLIIGIISFDKSDVLASPAREVNTLEEFKTAIAEESDAIYILSDITITEKIENDKSKIYVTNGATLTVGENGCLMCQRKASNYNPYLAVLAPEKAPTDVTDPVGAKLIVKDGGVVSITAGLRVAQYASVELAKGKIIVDSPNASIGESSDIDGNGLVNYGTITVSGEVTEFAVGGSNSYNEDYDYINFISSASQVVFHNKSTGQILLHGGSFAINSGVYHEVYNAHTEGAKELCVNEGLISVDGTAGMYIEDTSDNYTYDGTEKSVFHGFYNSGTMELGGLAQSKHKFSQEDGIKYWNCGYSEGNCLNFVYLIPVLELWSGKLSNDGTINIQNTGEDSLGFRAHEIENGAFSILDNSGEINVKNTAGAGMYVSGVEGPSAIDNQKSGVINISNEGQSVGIDVRRVTSRDQYKKVPFNNYGQVNIMNTDRINSIGLIWSEEIYNAGTITNDGTVGYEHRSRPFMIYDETEKDWILPENHEELFKPALVEGSNAIVMASGTNVIQYQLVCDPVNHEDSYCDYIINDSCYIRGYEPYSEEAVGSSARAFLPEGETITLKVHTDTNIDSAKTTKTVKSLADFYKEEYASNTINLYLGIQISDIAVADITLEVGETKKVVFICTPDNAYNPQCGVYANDDNGIVDITYDGNITGIQEGVYTALAWARTEENEYYEKEFKITVVKKSQSNTGTNTDNSQTTGTDTGTNAGNNTTTTQTNGTTTNVTSDTTNTTKTNASIGTSIKDNKTVGTYTVVSNDSVQYKESNGNTKTAIIPDTITVDGVVYKVVSIADNAFKNKKVTKITVGKNVQKIGKKAFWGCNKLKNLIIQSKSLKKSSFGKNAFAKLNSKVVVKVPKNKIKDYKKWMIKQGLNKKIKVKKI